MTALLTVKKPLPLSENDILRGMEALRGYVDLTPQDFKELYGVVHALAHERLLWEQTARNIMTTPVFTARQDMTLGDCIDLLAEKKISGVPVVDARGVVSGIVSEKDVLRLLGKQPEAHLMRIIADSVRQPLHPLADILHKRIAEAMTSPAVTARPETNLGELAKTFEQFAINRLPIVDGSGFALGIITRANLIRAFSECS